ncbi:MAG: EAL domain-containing protein [Vicinamibacteria bacterium]|nr:EAL domain-containing protein [Vicinamibacteria bacterium]
MDDVRRLIEERGSVAIVYLDLATGGQVETQHGWQAYDELLRDFAGALGGLREKGPMAHRDLIAVTAVRSDKFVVILGGGARAFDPPAAQAASDRLCQSLRGALEVRSRSAGSAPPAFHAGHALVYRDPMLRAERAVQRAVDEALRASRAARAKEDDASARRIDALVTEGRVFGWFQPIVSLEDNSVLGHEVFSRGAAGSPFEDPERLFTLAERTGRLQTLERVCRRQALSTVRRHLPAGAKLFINTSAASLADPELAGNTFARMVEGAGLAKGDVVLEITERVALSERRQFREALAGLKRRGFQIAVDDMGAGYSSLQSLVDVEPDYLKFDMTLVRHIDRSLIKRSLLETLVDLASRIGARVIAEGIEVESEYQVLRELGVPLGQGRLLAPPQPIPEEAR